MINIKDFILFIGNSFDSKQLFIDEFKPGLWFVEIDCFENQQYKMAIEVSVENIKISTVDKNPSIDFFLYDYVFQENRIAEDFIVETVKRQAFK